MQLSEVTIPGDDAHGDRPSPAVAVLPSGATRGMLVIHELFGRQPEIDRVVLRFAEAGYASVAPDLFASGKLACIRGLMRAMQVAEDSVSTNRRRWMPGRRSWTSSRAACDGTDSPSGSLPTGSARHTKIM